MLIISKLKKAHQRLSVGGEVFSFLRTSLFCEVHGFTLDDLAFRGTNYWVFKAHHVFHFVNEDGRGRTIDTWDE